MVEWIDNLGDFCGPGDVGLVTYLEFARGLHCYLTRADEPGLSITGAITLGGWVLFSPRGSNFNNAIIGKWYETGDQRAYVLYKKSNGEIAFSISELGINNLNTVTDQTIHNAPGKWLYIVGKYTPSTEIALFVNGDWYRNNVNIFPSIHDSTEPFEIGRYNRDNYLSGKLSHMFVAATAIPDAEIEAMYSHTRAMFAPNPQAPIDPSGISLRMTNASVGIEYIPQDYLRMTNAAVEIEYTPPNFLRMTNAGLMIEYEPPTFARMTNAGVEIEYTPASRLRMSNAGLMIEYSSTTSSSSSSSTSSSTTSSSSSVPP